MKKTLRRAYQSKAFVPTVIILIAIVILIMLPNTFVNPVYKNYERCKAKVLSVNNDALSQAGVIVYGQQYCNIEILSGEYKGKVCDAMNMLTGSLSEDKQFKAGDTALVMVGHEGNQNIFKATMVDHYRINYQAVMIGIFMLLMVGLAGWIGVRAILSFVFTILCIWKVLIPLLLKGVNPIICGLIITIILTCVIIGLVYGIDRRFLAAATGSLLGTGLTALLSLIFVRLLDIHGAVMNYSESMLYSGFNLNLTEIFIASIFIASSGALMDIAVDITSAVTEVVEANPNITRFGAVKAGMNVGRAALGTMTTTLLLAYSGGYIGLLMVFVAQGTPIINILNLNYVSAEILNTITGSFGLITVAPFTALTSGMLLTRTPAESKISLENIQESKI